jgi:hypothetical protein
MGLLEDNYTYEIKERKVKEKCQDQEYAQHAIRYIRYNEMAKE